MKKALVLSLTDQELQELLRILLDKDEAGALAFLEAHTRHRVREVLEGG